MSMNFEELDDKTREYMLRQFEAERSRPHPFHSATLSAHGHAVYPDLMREAIRRGNELQLVGTLARDGCWRPREVYELKG